MRVYVFVPPKFHALDLASLCDGLDLANRLATTPPHYDVRLVALASAPLRSSSGVRIIPDTTVAECAEPPELLILCSGDDQERALADAQAIGWIARMAAGAARFGAVGDATFLLGAAGLLDGRRATTHWDHAAGLVAAYPRATIETGRIFVRDGPLFSAAGGAAAMDLILNLIEEDHGLDMAMDLARHFVLFMKRSGGQSQFSSQLETQATTRDPIQRAQKYVRDNLTGDLSVAALAGVAAMSPRNFSRVFLQETRLRPADFVEISRVGMARRLLEESALSMQEIARLSGFSGAEAARRAFRRQLGVTMGGYRAGLSGAAPREDQAREDQAR